MWARNGRWILPEMPYFHIAFRDLLHAVNLRHGTHGFTSSPKEGVLRIFFALKNLTASAGFEPANLGTKGQHATSRPPKPLEFYVKKIPNCDLCSLTVVLLTVRLVGCVNGWVVPNIWKDFQGQAVQEQYTQWLGRWCWRSTREAWVATQ